MKWTVLQIGLLKNPVAFCFRLIEMRKDLTEEYERVTKLPLIPDVRIGDLVILPPGTNG